MMAENKKLSASTGVSDIAGVSDSADTSIANLIDHSNNPASDATRIDTPVRQVSYWQIMLIIGYLSIVAMIALLANLVWWVMLLLLMLSLIILVVMYWFHSPLIHITSPQLYHQHSRQQEQWQLLFDKPEYHELWEAKLVQCRDFGKCVQLNFAISHPMPETLYLILWQDQIDTHSWRRLKALSRW